MLYQSDFHSPLIQTCRLGPPRKSFAIGKKPFMRRACFTCLFVCLTTFLLSQSNPALTDPRAAQNSSPFQLGLSGRLRRQNQGPFDSGGLLRRLPFSSRRSDRLEYESSIKGSIQRNFQSSTADASTIFLEAGIYGSGVIDAISISVADVNGDGKLDLLVVNACADSGSCATSSVGVLLENGDGTFQTVQTYNLGDNYASSIAVADVNGDGKPDLLVANYCASLGLCGADDQPGSVGVSLGNGDGTFQTAQTYDSGSYYASSIAVADVNGDGKIDLLVANCGPGCYAGYGLGVASVLLGNGDGTFQAAQTYNTGGYSARTIAVGDIKGDGKPDILVVNEYNSYYEEGTASGVLLGVLLGNGDGTFQAAQGVTPFGTEALVYGQTASADFNGDGRLDVAAGELGALLLGNGDGTFQPALVLGAIGEGTAVGDFNGDGKPDLVVANGDSGLMILLNIAKRATTTSLTSSDGPSGFNQSVTFTAMVSPQYGGTATGTVTFYDGTTQIGSWKVSNNKAMLTISSHSIGNHFITAVYSGDGNFTGSTSNALSQVVNKATSITALLSSLNALLQGKSVTFTATVSSLAGTPTGKVEYLNGTSVLATVTLTSGPTKYTTSKLPAGSSSITAVYEGNSDNSGSTSAPVNQLVIAASITTLTLSPNPSTYGKAVNFAATVTSSIGAPPDGEKVTFMQGTTMLGTGTLNGDTATLSYSMLGVGTKSIKAVYQGDTDFAASTSKVEDQVVSKATSATTLTSSSNPSTFGQSVTFTAAVSAQFSGTPTGTVVFKDGTTTLKSVALSGGTASLIKAKLAIGSHGITATYSGGAERTSSSASVTQTVN